MHDGDILCPQHHIDSLLLGRIQIREVHRRKDKGLCLLTGIEEVTQITDTSFPFDGAVERL